MQQAVKSRLLAAFLSAVSITTAFGLAFLWNLEKPFWAGFTALLISMSTIGQSVQKSLLRVVGTIAGAVAGLAMLAQWEQQRWTLLVVLCLYLMFMIFCLLRSSKNSYFFYTATIVAVLLVVQSRAGASPFPLAVARLEETLLGIIVYTVFALVFWPRSSLEVLKNSVLSLMAEPGRLFDARQDILSSEQKTVDPALYRNAVSGIGRVIGLLPAARLEDYAVRRDIGEWNALFTMTEKLLQLQQEFLLRLGRMDDSARRRFFPRLDADMEELAAQLSFLGQWKPAVSLAQTEEDAPENSAAPDLGESGNASFFPARDALLSPGPGSLSLEPLGLQISAEELAQASPLDVNAVHYIEDSFSRQSRLVLGLLDTLDFLLGGPALAGSAEGMTDEAGSAEGRRLKAHLPDARHGAGTLSHGGSGSSQNFSAEMAADEPRAEWLTLAQMRQVGIAGILYWTVILLWIYWNPPGTRSTAFAEMSIMIGLVGFLAGRVEPVGIIVAFALGCCVAAPLYFGVMPLLTDFTQLAGLMLIVVFVVTWLFYLPAQAILRTGLLIPWFALSGLTNTREFAPDVFINGALTLMLCASTIGLVFYIGNGGHPARSFRNKQRRFLRALAVCLVFLSLEVSAGPFRGVRHLVRRFQAAWSNKLVRDLAPELMALSFAFSEEEQGQEPRVIKLLALNSYEVARRTSELIRVRMRRNGPLAEFANLKLSMPPHLAPESSWFGVLRCFTEAVKAGLPGGGKPEGLASRASDPGAAASDPAFIQTQDTAALEVGGHTRVLMAALAEVLENYLDNAQDVHWQELQVERF